MPSVIGRVHATRRTPVYALFTFLGLGVVIIGVWGLGHIIGGHATSGDMSALTMFDESSTFGTILVFIVYGLSNFALPFYYGSTFLTDSMRPSRRAPGDRRAVDTGAAVLPGEARPSHAL